MIKILYNIFAPSEELKDIVISHSPPFLDKFNFIFDGKELSMTFASIMSS